MIIFKSEALPGDETDGYRIEKTGPGIAAVISAGRSVNVRLEAPRAMPRGMQAALRKKGMDQSKYFFAGGSVIRIEALASWKAAVAAVDLRDYAHRAAHDVAVKTGLDTEAEREVADDGKGHPSLYVRMVRPNGTAYTRKAGI